MLSLVQSLALLIGTDVQRQLQRSLETAVAAVAKAKTTASRDLRCILIYVARARACVYISVCVCAYNRVRLTLRFYKCLVALLEIPSKVFAT